MAPPLIFIIFPVVENQIKIQYVYSLKHAMKSVF